jgi:hypothetical protein
MEQELLQQNRVRRAFNLQECRLHEDQPVHREPLNEPEWNSPTGIGDEASRYKFLEEEVKRLQVTIEVNQKNSAHLLRQNQEILKKEIYALRNAERLMKEEVERYRHALRERNNQLCTLELEVENMRASTALQSEAPAAPAPLQSTLNISRRAEKQLADLQFQIDQLLQDKQTLDETVESQHKEQEQLHAIIRDQNIALENQQQELHEKEERYTNLLAQQAEGKANLQQVESSLFSSRRQSGAQQIIAGAIEQLCPQLKTELESIDEAAQPLPPALRQLIDLTAFQYDLEHHTVPDASPFNLNLLLQQIETLYTAKADAKKIYFALSAAPLPAPLYTAPSKVTAVLDRLLTYAFEHIEKGRMGVHTSYDTTDGHLTINTQIAYTATEPEDPCLAQTFAASEEADHSQDNIALALLRLYARHLGGDITVAFRPNGLTTLNFTFSALPEAAA